MRIRARHLSTVMALVLLTACASPSATNTKTGSPKPGGPLTGTGAPARTPIVTASITGLVTVPSGIISGGAGNIISGGAGNIISGGAGNIISGGAGNVISGGAGNYRLLADEDVPLVGVEVYLADATGTRLPKLPSARTGINGSYRFPKVPTGFTFMIVAEAKTDTGKFVPLRSLTKASADGAIADISPITTVVTSVLIGDKKDMGTFDAAKFRQITDITREKMPTDKLPDLTKAASMATAMDEVAKLAPEVGTSMVDMRNTLATNITPAKTMVDTVADMLGTTASAPPIPNPGASSGSEPAPQVTILPDQGLKRPSGLAFLPNGDLLVADRYAHRIWRMDATRGPVPFLGSGVAGSLLGTATSTQLREPAAIATSGVTLYVAEAREGRVLKVGLAAAADLTAAPGDISLAIDGTTLRSNRPFGEAVGLALGADESLYVPDAADHVVYKIRAGSAAILSGDRDPGDSTEGKGQLAAPGGVAVTSGGKLYIADSGNDRLVEVSTDGTMTPLTLTSTLRFHRPSGLALDDQGHLFVADAGNRRIIDVNLTTGTAKALEVGEVCAVPGASGSQVLDGLGALAWRDGALYAVNGKRVLKIQLRAAATTPAPEPSEGATSADPAATSADPAATSAADN